jgi:hypothetical protein
MEALKMETPMDSWNDERLDELSRRMDDGFKEMREGFARIDQRVEQVVSREEMKELIASVNTRFDRVENEMKDGFARVDQRFEHVDQRFDRLYYAMVTALFGLVVSAILAMNFS